MTCLKYLGYGWIILIVAIIVNGIVRAMGGSTWYDYLLNISRLGIKGATMSLTLPEVLFLFFLYPAIFGFLVYLAVGRN